MNITPWDGKPISAPGCYSGLPIDVYHGGNACVGPSISSSGLRTIFQDSPLDYWVGSPLNPHREPEGEKEHFRIGRAAHHLMLGEADFSDHFTVRPDTYLDTKTRTEKPWSGNATFCRTWLEVERRTVLTSTDMQDIRGMAGLLPWQEGREDSGLRNSALVAHDGLLNGLVEHSFVWQDAETGVWLRSRPDAIPENGDINADLKTTESIDYTEIERTISNYRYDMQAALARMAMREVLGVEMVSFAFIFVGKKPPYGVRVVTLRDEDLVEAEKDLRVAINTFARCLERDRWLPAGGSQSDAVYVSLTPWAKQGAIARRAYLQQELAA